MYLLFLLVVMGVRALLRKLLRVFAELTLESGPVCGVGSKSIDLC